MLQTDLHGRTDADETLKGVVYPLDTDITMQQHINEEFGRYLRIARRYISRRYGRTIDAASREDVAHEALERILRLQARGQSITNMEATICKMCQYAAIGLFRRRSKHWKMRAEVQRDEGPSVAVDLPERRIKWYRCYEAVEGDMTIERLLKHLTPTERTAFQERYANRLERPVSWPRGGREDVAYGRARRKLAKLLSAVIIAETDTPQ